MTRFRWRDGVATRSARVTTLELFFDVVFVFTLTQLTQLLRFDLTLGGVAKIALLFGVLWYMYGGYAWLTNHVSPTRVSQRVLLLVGMAGFLVTALSIPGAFGDNGVFFGIGYLVVVLVHLALFSQSGSVQGVIRLAPFNLLSAFLVLAGGFASGAAVFVLWGAAFLIQLVTPYLGVAPRFDINPEHFVERHGLLMIVALGETVVTIGVSVEVEQLTAALVALIVLALALPAALWWTYFSGDDAEAEGILKQAGPADRGLMAVRGYYYAHIPMLLGIVIAAAGIHSAIAHPDASLELGAATALAGGVALFFTGDAVFRHTLGMDRLTPRLVVAITLLATISLGTNATAVLQLLAIVVLVAGALVVEQGVRGPPEGAV